MYASGKIRATALARRARCVVEQSRIQAYSGNSGNYAANLKVWKLISDVAVRIQAMSVRS